MDMKVKTPLAEEKAKAQSWPIWTKEISEFPWFYEDRETCFILEGQAIVVDAEENRINFGPGDWVVFEKGVSCTWKIISPIKKHYHFG